MITSKKGIDLIKNFEGLRLKAYVCSGGKITIGYGTTLYPNGNAVKITDTCTIEQAEAYLKNDLNKFEEAVNRLVGLLVNQNQFDALVCFTYNVGVGNLQSSTLLKMINLNNFEEASLQFERWNKAGGKELKGLTLRRLAEKKLFLEK